jgi:hypothetical protein
MAVDAGWCGALWKRGSTGGLRRLPRRTAMPARYVGQDEQVCEGNKCLRSTKLHEERLNVETEFSRQRRARVPLAKTPVGGPGRDEGKDGETLALETANRSQVQRQAPPRFALSARDYSSSLQRFPSHPASGQKCCEKRKGLDCFEAPSCFQRRCYFPARTTP